MEREKPLPWTVFVGSVLTMLSLIVLLVVNEELTGQAPYVYRTQPLANIVALVLIIVGIIVIFAGLRKAQ